MGRSPRAAPRGARRCPGAAACAAALLNLARSAGYERVAQNGRGCFEAPEGSRRNPQVMPSTWKTFKLRRLTKWRAAAASRREANCKLLTWHRARLISRPGAGAGTRPDTSPLPALSPPAQDAGLSAHHQVYGLCLSPSLTNGRIFQRPKNVWLHVS